MIRKKSNEGSKLEGFSRRDFLIASGGALAGSLIGVPQATFGNYHHQTLGEPRYGGIIKVGDRGGLVPGLDPHWHGSWGAFLMMHGTHQGLLDLGEGVSLHPCLATHWEVSDDVKEWTFHLRQGVKFSTGQEMTAEDVQFSIERVKNPKIGNRLNHRWRVLDRVDIVDTYTVKLVWKEPFAATLDSLRMYGAAIIPKDSAPKENTITGRGSVPGTGPFYFYEHEEGIIKARRNEYYWEKDPQGRPLPYLDEIWMLGLADDTVRTIALRNDEIQYTIEIAAKDVERLKGLPPGSPKFSDPEGVFNRDIGLVIANPINVSNWKEPQHFNE